MCDKETKEVANSSAVKGRQTKLGKKSPEELIDIILRKDDVERKQLTKINNLKEEVAGLILSKEKLTRENMKLESFVTDLREENRKFESLVKGLRGSLETYKAKLEESKTDVRNLMKTLSTDSNIVKKIKNSNKRLYIITAVLIVATIIAIIY